MQVSNVDITRAYFDALVEKDRPTIVALPPEDLDAAPPTGGGAGRVRRPFRAL